MQLLIFLASFVLLVFIGSYVIGGWFLITRGEEVTLPDGRTIRKGKIFKGWHFFWTQVIATDKIYYQGAQLKLMFQKISYALPPSYKAVVHDAAISIMETGMNSNITLEEWITKAEQQENIKIYNKGDGYYSIYKEFPVYRFPEFVRSPLAVCATCHSSLYGTLVYWLVMMLAGGQLFAWSSVPALAMFLFWIFYCFILSVTITAIAKKYN